MTASHDALVLLFTETRLARPPVWDCDARLAWFEAIGQVISAFPTAERRWAAMVLVASDLQNSMPGLPLGMAFGVIQEAVAKASLMEKV